jgi:outer membrane lipoprotein-sorting protein
MNNNGSDVEAGCNAYLEAYDALQNNPSSNDGRFTWFYNTESLTFVLHKATVNHLFKGVDYLSKFKEYLSQTSDKVQKELTHCMQTDLKRIGVGLT